MEFIRRIAWSLRELRGAKACAVAFAFGICFTLAFPPFWLLPLAAVAFTGWFWMFRAAASRKQAFWLGWWFGFGHHTTGLYWICIALGIDGGAYWWLMPFALCLLPAYLALYTGAVAALCHGGRRSPLATVVLFALVWLAAEWLRAHLIYGFPWNLAGYIWTISSATLQPASLVGVYGLSLWAVLFCVSFSLLAQPLAHFQRSANRGFAVIMAVTVALGGWGVLQLAGAEKNLAPAADIKLRLVQANVEQSLKWDPQFQLEALQRHINFSTRPAADGRAPDYILWPETAMPFQIEEGSQWTETLAALSPQDGALITGVVRSQGQGSSWQVWNSIRAVDSTGRITASYDKNILVPFGEFIPLRSALPFLPIDKITQGATDFSAGAGAQSLTIGSNAVDEAGTGSTTFQPLICYETIFAGFSPDVESGGEVEWLLNITNDAWFGTSTGPYQHLHMSRTRAVERGLPMVRVANTGVSAVFDAYGRMVASAPLNEEHVLDVMLPQKRAVPSWYSRHGEFTLIIICYILLMYGFRAKTEMS